MFLSAVYLPLLLGQCAGLNDDVPPLAAIPDLKQAAQELNTGIGVLRGLVRSGELPAIQIGGRGQWRAERTVLEEFIRHAYVRSRMDNGAEVKEDAGPRAGESLSG